MYHGIWLHRLCVLYLLISLWIIFHFTRLICNVILYIELSVCGTFILHWSQICYALFLEFTLLPIAVTVRDWKNSEPLVSGQFILSADKHRFTVSPLLGSMHHISVGWKLVCTECAVSGNNNILFFNSPNSLSPLCDTGSQVCSDFTFPLSFIFWGLPMSWYPFDLCCGICFGICNTLLLCTPI